MSLEDHSGLKYHEADNRDDYDTHSDDSYGLLKRAYTASKRLAKILKEQEDKEREQSLLKTK
jgi:hypothetical protein|tara:strand:+ start:997 stop:1182 length:186 start_codon:yes stop_codon:yes gene_type:complete